MPSKQLFFDLYGLYRVEILSMKMVQDLLGLCIVYILPLFILLFAFSFSFFLAFMEINLMMKTFLSDTINQVCTLFIRICIVICHDICIS